ncbi:MAG: hypothetical protein ABIM99_06385 [Candidatus Dojkabacteria bacterium]
MIVEFNEGAKLTPDLNLIRSINKNKKKIEIEQKVTLNHAIAIIPKKFSKTYTLFKFIAKYFSKDKELGMIVNHYKEAIDIIESIDHVIDVESFEKSIE